MSTSSDTPVGHVLLIHGLTGTPNELQFVAKFLCTQGFSVTLPWLANHGAPLEVLRQTTWQQCYAGVRQTLLDLEEAGDPRPLFVSGLSMGALLALLLAEEFPERVAGVSCLSPTLFYDGWNVPWWHRRLLAPLLCGSPLRHCLLFKEIPPYGIKNPAVRERVHRYYASAAVNDTSAAAKYGYPYIPVTLLHELDLLVRHLRTRLPAVHAPMQLIQASHDDLTSVRNAQFLYDRVGSTVKELTLLDDSYHVITADQQREQVAERMTAFFRRVAASLQPLALAARNGHAGASSSTPAFRLAECAVFIDFDNTVTLGDVVDKFLERFAVDPDWLELEEAWREGRMGSRECLEGQLRSIRTTTERLEQYLSGIAIDPSFSALTASLRAHRVPLHIVSDGFSSFIEVILRRHGVQGLAVYANDVHCVGDQWLPLFPYVDGCPRCANCKGRFLRDARLRGKRTVYIGDGLSDVCAAREADLVFAKADLLAHCQQAHIPCIPFKDLGEVLQAFERMT